MCQYDFFFSPFHPHVSLWQKYLFGVALKWFVWMKTAPINPQIIAVEEVSTGSSGTAFALCCSETLCFVIAGTPFRSRWSRSARCSSSRARQAAWGRTRPSSTSMTSRSISTWSRGTWSIWSSAALRSGSGCIDAESKFSVSLPDWSSDPLAESCWEGGEVPWGSPHAVVLVHHAFHNLHRGSVGAVLLLHHVQVRRHVSRPRTPTVPPTASINVLFSCFLQESTGSGGKEVLLIVLYARVRLYKWGKVLFSFQWFDCGQILSYCTWKGSFCCRRWL